MSPYLVLLLVGFLPNEIWRLLGVWSARGIDEDSELIVWVRAVATAVLAAVIAKLTLVPPGALAGGAAGGAACRYRLAASWHSWSCGARSLPVSWSASSCFSFGGLIFPA